MGVTGDLLNRVLTTAARDIDLRNYSRGIEDCSSKEIRPLRIGVDVSGWIARATHGHGSMLVDERHLTNFGRAQLQNKNNHARMVEGCDALDFTNAESRNKYIKVCATYVLDRILALQSTAKAQLLVVFDGKSPPLKLNENGKRFAKKQAAMEQRDAQGGDNNARLKAAKRTGAGASYAAIIEELMISLRIQKITFLVSPYEADGQLAFLSEYGMVDLVLTEDSDLIAHGVRSILYKEDGGRGKLIQRGDLGAMDLLPKSLSLMDFSDCMLAVLFVCVGCDYCTSLKMIGSVTAKEIVEYAFHLSKLDHRPPLVKVFERLYSKSNQVLDEQGKLDFESSFLSALFMYRHPIIFDPIKAKCALMRNPPFGSDRELMEHEPYRKLCHNQEQQQQILGELFPTELQPLIAEGFVDPRTMQPYPHTAIPKKVILEWKAWNKRQRASLKRNYMPDQPRNNVHLQALFQEMEQQDSEQVSDNDIEDDKGPETQAQDVAMNQESQGMDIDNPETHTNDHQHPETQCDDSEYPATQGIETQDDAAIPTMEQPSQASNGPVSTQDSPRCSTQELIKVLDSNVSHWQSPPPFRPAPSTDVYYSQGTRLDLADESTNDVLVSPQPGCNLTGSSSDNPATQGSHPSQLSADMMSPPLLPPSRAK